MKRHRRRIIFAAILAGALSFGFLNCSGEWRALKSSETMASETNSEIQPMGKVSSGPFVYFDPRIFNLAAYRRYNPAIAGSSDADLKTHWKLHGLREGRAAHDGFKVREYLQIYPALAQAFRNTDGSLDYEGAAYHFLINGIREHRRGSLQSPATWPAPLTPAVTMTGGGGYLFYSYTQSPAPCRRRFDNNLRGFFDANGNIQLLAGTPDNYRMMGGNLDQLQLDCTNGPVLTSNHLLNQGSEYRDYEWIASPYTLDGQNIHALIHNEYHFGLSVEPNPSPLFNFNQKMTLTNFLSTDGGSHYLPSTTNFFLAKQPIRFPYITVPFQGWNVHGFFSPSNIMRSPIDNFFYVMFNYKPDGRDGRGQGICMAQNRSGNMDPTQWRGWNGTDFVSRIHDGEPCAPLANIGVMAESLTYNTALQKFLLIGWPLAGISDQLSYSVSDNLRDWSTPRPVQLPTGVSFKPACCGGLYGYVSLIDDVGGSANFDITGREPWMFIMAFNADSNGAASQTESIWKYRLRIGQ